MPQTPTPTPASPTLARRTAASPTQTTPTPQTPTPTPASPTLARPDITEPEPEPLTDIDGNTYTTVQIGEQLWMAENLRVRTLRDGRPLVREGDAEDWHYWPDEERAPAQFTVPRWAGGSLEGFLGGDVPEDYYGLFYNERAVRSGLLFPEGWRLPSTEDFEELFAFAEANGEGATVMDALLATESWGPAGDENNGLDLFGFRLLSAGYANAFGGATGAPVIAVLLTDGLDEDERQRTVLFAEPGGESGIGFIEHSVSLGGAVRLIRED